MDLLVAPFLPDLVQVLEGFLIVSGQLEVGLEVSVLQDGANEVVLINVGNFVLDLGDDGDLNGGGGGGGILVFLVGEDVDTDDGGFGGPMLPGLGGRVLGNLAGVAFKHAVASLLDGTGGGGFAIGGAGLSLFKIFVVGHLLKLNICWFEFNSFINTPYHLHHNSSLIILLLKSLFVSSQNVLLLAHCHQNREKYSFFSSFLPAFLQLLIDLLVVSGQFEILS